MTSLKKNSLIFFLAFLIAAPSLAQSGKSPKEDDFYKIVTLPVPEGILLEVGGVATLPDGRIAVSTRRGDVWIVENATMENNSAPRFTLFASGLHEALGALYHNGSLYVAQRGELTRLSDKDGDGKADVYETVYSWPISGHYHEYSFGPKLAPDGSFFVSGNVAFGDEEWWRGESRRPGRGAIMKIHPDGTMEMWATGMRSPCGLGIINGELFYTDNQGDWVGSGGMWQVNKGDFMGHPAGLRWSDMPGAAVKLTTEQLYARVDPRQIKREGQYIKPENDANEKNPNFLYEVKKDIPELKLPAIWLPHGILGISNSEIITDDTHGKFGPFSDQIFIGDQGQSKIMRVVLEKVKGEYQGVAFDFKSGFESGVLRMSFGHDGSMFAGLTNRGWGSAGTATSGLQRLVWTGKTPFEMKTVKAMPDGFEIEFTLPVDRKTAEDLSSYTGRSWIYKYQPVYGSPTVNVENLMIKGVKLSDDNMKVRVVIDNLRQHYLHELNIPGIRAAGSGVTTVHPTAYYMLNNLQDGEKLPLNQLSTKKSVVSTAVKESSAVRSAEIKSAKKAPTYAEIEPLLVKNTCTACHQVNKRQVGPAFVDVAKRKYSNEKILELIYTPQPKNWPEYATPMAAMPQVPKDEALKIAAFINSLRQEAP